MSPVRRRMGLVSFVSPAEPGRGREAAAGGIDIGPGRAAGQAVPVQPRSDGPITLPVR